MKKFLLTCSIIALASPAFAQNLASGSPRVQGVPDGYGDPVQVTIVNADGSGTGSTTAVVTQSTASNLNAQIVGVAASGAADSGNPVKTGGRYNSTLPTFTDGQRGDFQIGTRGALNVQNMFANTATPFLGLADNADGVAVSATTDKLGEISRMVAFNGTSWDRLRGDTNGVASTPGLSSLTWTYANGATGILSNTTTAVTIKTAAGASVRNYIDSCQINTTAFGASVPLAIRDGAGGTVLFALNVPTAGFLQPVNITFMQPLRGTANTLLEVVTTTANTSGTVWVNCQGHTGA